MKRETIKVEKAAAAGNFKRESSDFPTGLYDSLAHTFPEG
jgi:hypothetical protein